MKMIMLSSYFPGWGMPPSFQENQAEETFPVWRWVRNRILSLTGKILLHRKLIQRGKLSLSNPCNPKDDK